MSSPEQFEGSLDKYDGSFEHAQEISDKTLQPSMGSVSESVSSLNKEYERLFEIFNQVQDKIDALEYAARKMDKSDPRREELRRRTRNLYLAMNEIARQEDAVHDQMDDLWDFIKENRANTPEPPLTQ